LLLILFESDARLLDLFLGSGAGLLEGLGTRLIGFLSTSFLELEDFLAGFAKALLVIGGAGLGGGNVGTRFFHRPLSAAAALGEDGGERAIDEESIKGVKQRHEEDGRHGSEQ
jgi:hypothetical protein